LYQLAPFLPEDPDAEFERENDIDLPCGSLFVRYLLNRVEQNDPYADNLKPVTKYIKSLFVRHPFVALEFVWNDGCYMSAKMRRACGSVGRQRWAARAKAHDDRLGELANAPGLGKDLLIEFDAAREPNVLREPSRRWVNLLRQLMRAGVLLPLLFLVALVLASAVAVVGLSLVHIVAPSLLPPVIMEVVRPTAPWAVGVLVAIGAAFGIAALLRKKDEPPGYLTAAADRIAKRVGVQYVAMGHTHDPELSAIGHVQPNGRCQQEYFNTGTWTKVFCEETRLVRDDAEFTFLEGLRVKSGLQLRLQHWDAAAGEPRLARLMRSSQSPTSAGS
jgi:hypothetical protein